MGGKKPKKRKPDDPVTGVEESETSGESEEDEAEIDKYKPCKDSTYKRLYSNNTGNADYIVFLESTDEKPIGERDKMYLANILNRYHKGIKQFKAINKYRIGVIFDTANNANLLLQNDKFLEQYKCKANIPARSTEVTGVIQAVSLSLSNKQIVKTASETPKIIAIRRIMRKVVETKTLTPTKTIVVTFASTSLPESISINQWNFNIKPYIPPVKQCFNCLKYGHLAKFCRNSTKCSICTLNHSFKECITDPKNACCANCKGNHVAVSIECPIKKEKIYENKKKLRSFTFADILTNVEFPSYTNRNVTNKTPKQFSAQSILNNILQSDETLRLLLEALSHITVNKKQLNNQSFRETLKQLITDKKAPTISNSI
jgi:hypothetical protein